MPSPPRRDPVGDQPVDFAERAQDGVVVKRRDPGQRYALVGKDPVSLERYILQGYKRVPKSADGPYIFSESADAFSDEWVEFMGHVLMCIPVERSKQNEKHGVPEINAKGMDECEKIERRIVVNGGVDDPMRGMHHRGGPIYIESDTTALKAG